MLWRRFCFAGYASIPNACSPPGKAVAEVPDLRNADTRKSHPDRSSANNRNGRRSSYPRSVLSLSGLVRIARIYNGTRDMRDLLVDGPWL
jgi:hypothetical protein